MANDLPTRTRPISAPIGNFDIRAFGGRMVATNVAPAIPGITATINAGSRVASISDASSFHTGDGVIVYGAGPDCNLKTPSTPKVTPSIAAVGTGTGIVVDDRSGGTSSYSYEVVARNTKGCLTVASRTGSTSYGSDTLGSHSAKIVSARLAAATERPYGEVVVTTLSAHHLSVGSMVDIAGTSDAGIFDGWWTVASVPDQTHFTYLTQLSPMNGTVISAASTEGIVYSWHCNHVSWDAVPGAWVYYIYGRNAGELTLLGVSRPQTDTLTDPTWDDFGAVMMGNFTAPYFASRLAPRSPLPEPLVTTISAGGGTARLTLAKAADNSVSSATILFTDGPALIAAANATRAGLGPIYIPETGLGGSCFVINSFTQLPKDFGVSIWQAGQVCLNETLALGGATKWYGDRTPLVFTTPQFSFQSNVPISIGNAYPGVFGNGLFQGLQFQSAIVNNAELVVNDSANFAKYEDTTFLTNSPGDYMGVGLILRGNSGMDAPFEIFLDRTTLTGGITQEHGKSATPVFYGNFVNVVEMNHTTISLRGLIFRGGGLDMHWGYAQGNVMPFLTYVSTAGGPLEMRNVNLDTSTEPILWLARGRLNTGVTLEDIYTTGSGSNAITGYGYGPLHYRNVFTSPASLPGSATLTRQDYVLDGLEPMPYSVQNNVFNSLVTLGHDETLFVLDNILPKTPQCNTALAGPPYTQKGTWRYAYSFVYPNNGVGLQSPFSTACASNGKTEQITVTMAPLPPGAKGYWLVTQDGNVACLVPPLTTSRAYVDLRPHCNGSTVTAAAGGPAGMQNGLIWASKLLTGTEYTEGQCFSSSSPADCASYIDGFVAIPPDSSSVVVNTTEVTSKSEISLTFDVSQGRNLGVTCNPTAQQPYVSSRAASKSFTISVPSKFLTTPGCIGFHLKN